MTLTLPPHPLVLVEMLADRIEALEQRVRELEGKQ